MAAKPKLSMYWASSCGGCEVSLVNINEKILDVAANFDFYFCPCLLDTKKKDIEALKDGEIAITFFNGAIRTEENEEMAHLMRKKSAVLIAFGSCSYEGCIPGLSNLHTKAAHFDSIYLNNPTVDNPLGIVPKPETTVPEGKLTIPAFYEKVKTLSQVVDVDYSIPGCPPEPKQVWNVIEAVIQGKTLPPKGSLLGAGNSTVCQECERKKEDKKITRIYRTYEIIPDVETCLLEQGLLCMGIATSDGCGALCPKVNMPCTGCYGPPVGTLDQGAKMVAALGSIIDIGEKKGLSEDELARRADLIIDSMPDYSGTFYKYSLAGSILGGRKA
ncbi:MAG: NADH:ubiquinone oxidoreductase [Nitrospirae bacterium]|nr:NADH:ubiquinone oxidoreductase [Nitrospirota bacterium]MBF0535930.1 NADH:ubiquinone oxidoreductase [Nitrospirota bacterium]MBF0617738.1 NADH:ubiquinone oxidoreductase [Nitrospirota bacterium]